jgi:hypothetical protein
MGKEDKGLDVTTQNPTMTLLKDQSCLLWQQRGEPLFAMSTGWGDRSELEMSLGWLEAFKCPQKLFVYSCNRWQDVVVDQIHASLQRYPYHIEGEQYLFMNLVGAENRFHLLVADLGFSGRQPSRNEPLLRPVVGSPFGWGTKKNAS